MKKRKQYNSAPLPFQGQKHRFARDFTKILRHFPDDSVFVDLFGGSGLLSHITKCHRRLQRLRRLPVPLGARVRNQRAVSAAPCDIERCAAPQVGARRY